TQEQLSQTVQLYNCATQPTYTNATFTTGIPNQVNQAWQNTNNANPCYYTCINGYTGSDCSTPPIVPSCATQPSYVNASYTVGTPTQVNQARQNTNNSNPCYYTCINGYTGSDCSIPSFLAICTANGQIIYTDANGVELGRVDNAGTTISGNPGALTCAGHIIMCAGSNSGYTLQACNLGSSVVGAIATSASYGYYYQWGRNKSFPYGDTTQQATPIAGSVGLNASTDMYGFVWDSALPSPYTWASTDITNNWGHTTNTNLARQGPCPANYHVPTNQEWNAVKTSWGGNPTYGSYFSSALKLPYAGFRSRASGGAFSQQAARGFYWTSTPIDTLNTYCLTFYSSGIYPGTSRVRASGSSVRCFKN
nr:FISUMP domain-containing protein [Candidatus Gracilibacteria bacterium]